MNLKFDPKILITSPYWDCPKCGEKNSFGVLSIYNQHYIRRCRNCHHEESYHLPKLNKKVIYLDQFVISNMMKFYNPETKANSNNKVDKFYGLLFRKLDSLCKLQLIVCPDSSFHEDESNLSPFPKPLKDMYEFLSHGISFKDCFDIKKHQIFEHSQIWIKRKGKINFNVNEVLYGNINKWAERYYISIESPLKQQLVDELVMRKEHSYQDFITDFLRWQKDKKKTFNDWFNEQSALIGPYFLREYCTYYKKMQDMYNGIIEPTDEIVNPPFGVEIVMNVIHSFNISGVNNEEMVSKIFEYFNSPEAWREIPFVKLSAMLIASLAKRASQGQTKLPNQGTLYDFNIISVLMPYCNAMFIDKGCHSLINEIPTPYNQEIKKYSTRIFSLNNKEEFIEYLDQIGNDASKEHIEKVKEVYGENYLKPCTTMYKKY